MNSNKGIGNFCSNFARFAPLLGNLTLKDIKIKYRRSVLGMAWSVLNPLLTMLVLSVVFGKLLRIKPAGVDFAVYYIVGAVIWNFFSEATSGSMTSILASAALIKKVYIPKYMFPLEKCLFALVNMIFTCVAAGAVVVLKQHPVGPSALLFFVPIIYCFVFCVGVSLILSAVSVYFRDIIHLYSVVLTLWMYMTPLIYPIETITNGDINIPAANIVFQIIKWNPLTKYIDYFRDLIVYNTIPNLTDNLVCIGYAVVALIVGVLVFSKAQKKFILHI